MQVLSKLARSSFTTVRAKASIRVKLVIYQSSKRTSLFLGPTLSRKDHVPSGKDLALNIGLPDL